MGLLRSKNMAVAALLAMTVPATAEIEEQTLQMAHDYSPGNVWYETSMRFVDNVAEATDGKVTFNVADSGSTGSWVEQIEALTFGTNDVVLQSVGTLDGYGALAGIEAYPYLIRDLDHFRTVYQGELGQELYDDIAEATGFKIAGAGYRGARILTTNAPIESVEDLAGVKLRVPPLKMYTRTWELLGASPTPMPFSEVFTSLQQGVIDGQENPYEIVDSFRMDEVQSHVTETNHVLGAMTFIFDASTFEGYDPELQEVLQTAAEEAMSWGTEQLIEKENELRAALQDRGMIIASPNLTAFRDRVAPIKEDFPDLAEWVERIQNVD
ncbi:TRAP transporter substrate-binding protein [Roseovarius gahaiensis]|uniref:TRAP transporter substrate-binding protein n=1 Tax=Roseovarius gahaiensis TaxID=2716691 RepID=A0A967BHQ3_9RHOB|nr:TRAP transporter substrate-binding protein [Roseovarius gahaiensis]NHQ75313.1 TRAP transporter substrate-binding protein [Roseovarius gahaiensis]